ncbi:hypothetical protein ACWOFK_00175 [Aerococcus urinaehominis]
MAPFISLMALNAYFLLAGFLGLLAPALIVAKLVGLALFIYTLFYYIFPYFKNTQLRQKKFYWDQWPVWLVSFIAIVYYFILKDKTLIHYDNFSHWALILKTLLLFDHWPTAANSFTEFANYPPAAATFLYYFTKTSQMTEGMAIYGQFILRLGAWTTIFSLREHKRLIAQPSLSSFLVDLSLLAIFLVGLIGVRHINVLLVDDLVAAYGIAGLLVLKYAFDHQFKPRLIGGLFGLISFVLILTKSSAIFFWAVMAAYYCYRLYRSNHHKSGLAYLPLLTPLITSWAWQSYVTSNFPADRLGKFAASQAQLKAPAQIKTIMSEFILASCKYLKFSKPLLLALVIVVICIGLLKIKHVKSSISILKKISLIALLVFAYSLSVLVMYIYQMPLDEALKLAGFGRYMETIRIYASVLLGLCCYQYISYLDLQTKFRYRKFLALPLIALTLGFLFSQRSNDYKNFFNPQAESQENLVLEKQLQFLPANKLTSQAPSASYIFYLDPDLLENNSFVSYYLKYRLYQPNIQIVDQVDQIPQLGATADYLILPDDLVNQQFSQLKLEKIAPNLYQLD